MLPQEGPAVGFTVRLKFTVKVRGEGLVESSTSTEKFVFPAAVGVPEMAPAEERDKPAGREVLFARANVYGATPPVAVRVVEYALFRTAAGKLDGPRVRLAAAEPMVMVNAALAVSGVLYESVTTMVNG
jgi:hypothetical protein